MQECVMAFLAYCAARKFTRRPAIGPYAIIAEFRSLYFLDMLEYRQLPEFIIEIRWTLFILTHYAVTRYLGYEFFILTILFTLTASHLFGRWFALASFHIYYLRLFAMRRSRFYIRIRIIARGWEIRLSPTSPSICLTRILAFCFLWDARSSQIRVPKVLSDAICCWVSSASFIKSLVFFSFSCTDKFTNLRDVARLKFDLIGTF